MTGTSLPPLVFLLLSESNSAERARSTLSSEVARFLVGCAELGRESRSDLPRAQWSPRIPSKRQPRASDLPRGQEPQPGFRPVVGRCPLFTWVSLWQSQRERLVGLHLIGLNSCSMGCGASSKSTVRRLVPLS